MKLDFSRKPAVSPIDIESAALSILRVQKSNGEIPWSDGGKTDPWDHVEAAMGLSIAGYLSQAEHAYQWMASTQMEDGSWWAAYRNGKPEDMTKDANMCSYIAVGVFHHYLITKDVIFLKEMWPTIKVAIDFAISLQAPSGEIFWAKNSEGSVDPAALLTGSSSIYMSIKCALAVASRLKKAEPRWEFALKKLGNAIRHKPHLFDSTKSRYSMDWYYPVLSGALTGKSASERIAAFWNKFIVEDLGVRCVSDQPWITIAETSELTLSLAAIGDFKKAELVFNWIQDRKYDDGSYWCGFTFPDMVIWTDEKLTWTAGVVLMAADALNDITPASQLFNHSFWEHLDLLPSYTKVIYHEPYKKAEGEEEHHILNLKHISRVSELVRRPLYTTTAQTPRERGNVPQAMECRDLRLSHRDRRFSQCNHFP